MLASHAIARVPMADKIALQAAPELGAASA